MPVFSRYFAWLGPTFLTALRTVPFVIRPAISLIRLISLNRLTAAAKIGLVPAAGSVVMGLAPAAGSGIWLVHGSP